MAFIRSGEWFASKRIDLETSIFETKELLEELKGLPGDTPRSEHFRARQTKVNKAYLHILERLLKKHVLEYQKWRNKMQNLERGCPPYRGY